VVKVAIECLKGEDDSYVKYHPSQSGRENSIGNGLSEREGLFTKTSDIRRVQRIIKEIDICRLSPSKDLKIPAREGEKRAFPMGKAEEDPMGRKSGVDLNLFFSVGSKNHFSHRSCSRNSKYLWVKQARF